ncbi:MetQ/NlpA family ABC transporter substrate-binding protein [Paracoccus liaowanqingii]|uniref:MetQ/NlpA family ABC transporter substrate-binding protein n=1 Tax=Paracoccus liaowanqingii TaxID=2560053 RepID=A0A4Z1BR30_9RHOB|nr:MetQ/NlpA family ABC transporter substrate-binding protein [Paracoccus liaowanqingii]TGN46392.1 MetQ/NlpA family ABC transporter substrate-binding protein [Paracoccus liaowanqingii]
MLRLTTFVSALALSTAAMASTALAQDITVGVSPGEHGEIMEKVAEVAAPLGLNIEVIEFSDYVVPNQALADGDLDANSFQHRPYLENQISDRGFGLVEVGTTITTPMGIYSDRIEDLADLPEGAQVAIPNDPTNGGRALLILQDLGIITLTEGTGLVPSPLDVAENPKGLQFLELDAAQLPRTLADADIAIINTNYALASGLSPKGDAIAMEKADSPYVNIIVVQEGREAEPWVQTLVEAYHSPEVKAFIDETYEGAVLTSW